ncbi:MAG TPA: type IV toxin-antitoxin system AbiEi family antitoxin domain-containing protein [bacterium]|nr:type IV toxin-antitoxin system AbiEi family antitoxin domain-containing protein [bacterium]
MKAQKFFARHPVFTSREFAAFHESEGTSNVRTQESLLAHHTRTGRILRVRRGLYVVVPNGTDPENCPVDPYLVAAKMTNDSVLGYHTALEFHGRAYSLFEQSLYLTSQASRPLTFRSHTFRRVLFPTALRAKGQQNFGVKVAERRGVDVHVTSLERTLVDVLDRPDLSGSWEEIWRSLESIEFFDLDEVVEYALLLDNATTTAKVGFFLEQHREPLMVEEAHLNRLREFRPRGPRYLVRSKRTRGRLVSGWNLVVPEALLARTWAEVT